MEKEKQAIKAKFDEEIRLNERKFSDLAKQKKELDEKKAIQFTAKKEITSYLNTMFDDLSGKEMSNDLRKLEELRATVEHENRLAEQAFEQEGIDIAKSKKELRLQVEETKRAYSSALREV